MMNVPHLFLGILFAALAVSADETNISFTAMGCGPYTGADEMAIRSYLLAENHRKVPPAFIVHLGDICAGNDARAGKIDEPYYVKIRSLLTVSNSIPTYIVPGDNEWNDMLDPNIAWGWWTNHFLRLDEALPAPPWQIRRQEVRSENFAFDHQGVLFIGINLVGGRVHDKAEWARRFTQNLDWIEQHFTAPESTSQVAVIFCQANPIGQGKIAEKVKKDFEPFCARLIPLCAAYKKPVLFLHADGHTWTKDTPWKDAPNVLRVQLDKITPDFPPVHVSIRPGQKKPFQFDRQHPKLPAPKKSLTSE